MDDQTDTSSININRNNVNHSDISALLQNFSNKKQEIKKDRFKLND